MAAKKARRKKKKPSKKARALKVPAAERTVESAPLEPWQIELAQEKRGVGRPTLYRTEYSRVAKFLYSRGADDVEVAEALGVARSTLSLWKTLYEEFSDAVSKNKLSADDLVERALFERAIGYKHPAVKIMQFEGSSFEHEFTQHYAPETGAIKFWLQNRQPKKWREKSSLTLEAGDSLEALLVRTNELERSRAADNTKGIDNGTSKTEA